MQFCNIGGEEMQIDIETNKRAKEFEEKMSCLDQKSKILVNTYIQAMLDRQKLEQNVGKDIDIKEEK